MKNKIISLIVISLLVITTCSIVVGAKENVYNYNIFKNKARHNNLSLFTNEFSDSSSIRSLKGEYEIWKLINEVLDNGTIGEKIIVISLLVFMVCLGYYSPYAEFDYEINGTNVTFKDKSHSVKNNLDKWHWDFGDGNNSILQNPKHMYAKPGNYTVRLEVISRNGVAAERVKEIRIKE